MQFSSINEHNLIITPTWLFLQLLLKTQIAKTKLSEVATKKTTNNATIAYSENTFFSLAEAQVHEFVKTALNVKYTIIFFRTAYNQIQKSINRLFSPLLQTTTTKLVNSEFLHSKWMNTNPKCASYYWTVGGSIDRSLSSLRQSNKWLKKWEYKTFDDLSPTAQQYIEKYGQTLGWPPRIPNVKFSAINLWATSPIPSHFSNADFWTIYANEKTNHLFLELQKNPQSVTFFSESTNTRWTNSTSRQLFSNYRFRKAVVLFTALSQEAYQIAQYFSFRVAGVQIKNDDYFELLTLFNYCENVQIKQTLNNSMFEFRIKPQLAMHKIMRVELITCTDNVSDSDTKFKQTSADTQSSSSFELFKFQNFTQQSILNLNSFCGNFKNILSFDQHKSYQNFSMSKKSQKILHENNFKTKQHNAENTIYGLIRLAEFRGFNLIGSRVNLSFILPNWGFLRTYVLQRNEIALYDWKHSIYYSANRIRRSNTFARFVLDRYASIPIIPNLPSNVNANAYVMHSTLNPFHSENVQTNINLQTHSNFNKYENPNTLINNTFDTQGHHAEWVKNEWRFLLDTNREMLNRVKFKNNLSKIWHTMRSHFATLLNLKFHYNKQLTKFLPCLYKKKGSTLFKSIEMQLYYIILRARIMLTPRSSIDLIQANLVFVNSYQILNPKMYVLRFDFIQIVLSAKYFVYFKWLYSWMLIKRNRLMPRVILIANARRNNRSKPITYPNWIIKSRYFDEDVPRYMEVDFISLSIAILDFPRVANEFDPFLFKHLNVYAPKMLNWKFIT